MTIFSSKIKNHISVFNELAKFEGKLNSVVDLCVNAFENGNKLILCGNGGSASDSQHIAGELVGRFLKDRSALPAISLTADISSLTAIGNDYGYEYIFSRQIEGLGTSEDILLVISTSGQSQNLINAIKSANKQEMETVGLLGNEGGVIKNMLNLSIVINSKNTARIQECHGLIIHLICKIVDINMANS